MLHTDHEKLCVEHINLKLVLHYTFRTSYVLVHSLYHHQHRRSRTIYCATAMNGVEGATNNQHFYVGILTTLNLAVEADVLAFLRLFFQSTLCICRVHTKRSFCEL